MQTFFHAVKRVFSLISFYIGKGIPLVVFALPMFIAYNQHRSHQGQQLAGSMKWFEIEARKSLCTPSPVNRLVRPMVCLGFETGVKSVAMSNPVSLEKSKLI